MAAESFAGFDLRHPGFNGGVQLQHLGRMRATSFTEKLDRMVQTSQHSNFVRTRMGEARASGVDWA